MKRGVPLESSTPQAKRVFGGTGACRSFFGLGDQSFIFPVGSTHSTVMTQIGKALVGLMTVTFVVHATNPIHHAEAMWCFLDLFYSAAGYLRPA